MQNHQLFSRRTGAVDFRPDDPGGKSPFAQLRRLSAHLKISVAQPEDITDCDDALYYYRYYCFRKLFTNTTHDEFVRLDKVSPEVIDWSLAVHSVASEAYQTQKRFTQS